MIYKEIRLTTAAVLLMFILSSCGTAADDRTDRGSNPPVSHAPESQPPQIEPTPEDRKDDEVIGNKIDAILGEMTIEEKIGQMFFIAYRQDEDGSDVLAMDEYLGSLLAEYKPGGFVLFAENLHDTDQTVKLIQDIKDCSKIPPFISIDEEGGDVSRLGMAPLIGSTVMPTAFEVGLTGDPNNAYEGAAVIARELSSLGFNMDFAPVADIFSNPENTVIGKRAYGTDPASVCPMVARAVEGFCDNNIIPVLKHFPGHGDTHADTHEGAAEVTHDMARLESYELLPFKAGFDAGADAIMTAHILLPNVTSEPVPASLSKEIMTGILRERLGFDGVVITDALEMKAISAYYGQGDAAVKAVDAGVDMLLMPLSLDEAYRALLAAVKSGAVPESRIDESVRRILSLKDKYRLFEAYDRPDPESVLGSPEHQAVAGRIRKEAGRK
jgi:beta-N-acetylhexosaminidase